MDELRDASMLLLETAGPWLLSALESAVDALPAAVQCQGVEGLHALATLPETLEMATAEEYSAALYDAYTATIAAGTSWVQLLSLLGRPCLRLLHVLTLPLMLARPRSLSPLSPPPYMMPMPMCVPHLAHAA